MAAKTIKIESPVHRILLAAALCVCLTATFFFAKWCFGNSISTRADYKEVADVAVSLAPGDPQTHYALAVLSEDTFLPEDLARSLAEYEKATALAPDDFRVWLALGRAREKNGDRAGARTALEKALSLAPNYAQVHWTLGNVLLRQGQTEEAYAHIRRAAESDRSYLEPAVSTAWQIFDGDMAEIRKYLGGGTELSFTLATFLAKQKRFDESLEIWKTLPAEDRKTVFRETGRILADEMIAAKKYRDSLEVHNQIAGTDAEIVKVGQIFNPGFEADVNPDKPGFFEWKLGEGIKPQIGFDDSQRHGGNRSLVILFNSTDGQSFRSLSQTVVVEGGQRYRFSAFFKSALKTSATLKWEIVETSDGHLLASTEAVPDEADWTELETDFTAPESTQAVTIRLAREKCGRGICPISGRVWFDDFSLSQ
ncbi:MAG: tetratricopeptide repeat protein [Pyrinomonadaceae bacterium]